MKKIIFIIVLIASYEISSAQKPAVMASTKPGWHKIATQHVSLKTEKDEVLVLGNDRFRQIKLKAKDAGVDLMSFDVYFEGDTTVQTIPVGKRLNAGEETATASLSHNLPVKKVVLVYKTIPKTTPAGEKEKEKAEVEIWGLK